MNLEYVGETVCSRWIIASCRDGKTYYRILFNPEGEYITCPATAKEVGQWLGLEFTPGALDGNKCFINSEIVE